MKRRTAVIIGAAIAVAATAGGIGAVAATSDDDGTEVPITGEAYDAATTAALAHVGEGRVTETEAGDEEGAYEVEITRDDGSQVDVHLDESFRVIGTEDDGADDESGADDE